MHHTTGLAIRLAGYNVSFRVDRDVDGGCLYIKTLECDYTISMSYEQYDALEAAINDSEDMATGEWFGNSE